MTITGKTGADALNRFAQNSLRTLQRYSAKMSIVIAAAVAAGAITSGEAALIQAYIDAMLLAGGALAKLAKYSSIN